MPLTKERILSQIKNNLIVSVQADKGEPFYDLAALGVMIQAVVNGGACGLRLANPASIQWARKNFPALPIIGITKPEPIPENFRELVYITPTWADIEKVADAGANIVAIDGTQRPRPNGEALDVLVNRFRNTYPEKLLMADIDTVGNAVYCESLGVNLIATTLNGYTQETLGTRDNFDLLHKLADRLKTPIVMEGKINAPSDVKKAFDCGAFSVVVGSAITRPHLITQQFKLACDS